MNEQVLYDVYTGLRDIGFVKLYDEMRANFVMEVAETRTHPFSKEFIIEKLKALPSYDIPVDYIEFLGAVLKDTDHIRYHKVPLDGIIIHYFVITNDDLKGRVPEKENISSAFTKMRVNTDEENPNAVIVDVDDNTVTAIPYYNIFAILMLGEKAPEFADDTNNPMGFTMKHELAHIVLKYVTEVVHPGFFDKYIGEGEDKLTEEELKLFIEFLCDFTQFDIVTTNKYTINPIAKFIDTAEVLFKANRIDEYAPFTRAISRYFK